MTTTERYNGWTNYETWNVKLWMDNDEGSYRYYWAMAQDAYDHAEAGPSFTREEQAALNLAECLKDEYEEAMQEFLERAGNPACVWSDLLSSALSSVNWDEIARSMIEDVDKTASDESDDEDAE